MNYVRWRALQKCWDLTGPIADAVGPTAEFEGLKVYVDPRFGRIVQQDLLVGGYENAELQILKIQLSAADVVMEIGAGLGVISSFCAQRIGSDRVFTYEANPAMERHIRRTHRLNGVAPTLEMCLIGEHAGTAPFWVGSLFWGSSTRKRGNGRWVSVPVKAFNAEVQRLHPSFLLIDIEGGESDLCRYATFHEVRKVMLEVHQDLIERDGVEFVRSQMHRAGFRLIRDLCVPPDLSVPHIFFFERP